MNDNSATLIEILAMTDGIFKPMRQADWTPPVPAVIYEHRTRFESDGVPWASGDSSVAGRKRTQRQLEGLAEAGLVTICKQKRRSGVKLTDRGDIIARALAGIPNIDAGHSSLCEILKYQDGKVCELLLAGLKRYDETDATTHEVWIVQRMMLPALWRGWVESNSDVYGHVQYRTTDLGRAIAKRKEPTLPPDLPAKDNEVNEIYTESTLSYRDQLRAATPEQTREIGYIPLSASWDDGFGKRIKSTKPARRSGNKQAPKKGKKGTV
jgi:hypothetical protein